MVLANIDFFYMVLLEAEGFIPVCYLLRTLIDQLFDQYRAEEPLADVRGNEIATQQFRVPVKAVRKHLPEFERRFARTEVTPVTRRWGVAEAELREGIAWLCATVSKGPNCARTLRAERRYPS